MCVYIRIAKSVFQKNKVERFILPNFKIYSKGIVIKTMQCQRNNKHIYKQNKINISEINKWKHMWSSDSFFFFFGPTDS